MKIHHLDCGTMYPYGGRLMTNQKRAKIVCHCLLIETDRGLVLVDSGIGMEDMNNLSRLGPTRYVMNVKPDPNATAYMQVKSLGYDPKDVSNIIITHLDLDHAGGLPDFPWAKVHLHYEEHKAAMNPTFLERKRYRKCHFSHSPQWEVYDLNEKRDWFGLEAVKSLNDIPESIILIPLPGHTRGHCGVAIAYEDKWLFHAGDLYYYCKQMDETPTCTTGLRMFQALSNLSSADAARTNMRVNQMVQKNRDKVKIICSHDLVEFESCKS